MKNKSIHFEDVLQEIEFIKNSNFKEKTLVFNETTAQTKELHLLLFNLLDIGYEISLVLDSDSKYYILTIKL